MSRAPERTEETMLDICERIASGQSLAGILRKMDISYRAVMRWLSEDEVFQHNYARARVAQADADADTISEIAERVLKGEVDPSAARVAIDAYKWTAGKRQPKKYGEKLAIGGADDLPPVAVGSPAEILKARLDAIRSRIAGEASED